MKVNIRLVHGGVPNGQFRQNMAILGQNHDFCNSRINNEFVSCLNSYKYYNPPIIHIWYLFRHTNIIISRFVGIFSDFFKKGVRGSKIIKRAVFSQNDPEYLE